jgi:hypothetical protein
MHLKSVISSILFAYATSSSSLFAYPKEFLSIPEDIRETEVGKIPLEGLLQIARNSSYQNPNKIKLFEDYVEVLSPRTNITSTEEVKFYFDLWTKVLFPLPPKLNAEQLKRYNVGLTQLKLLTAKVLKDKYTLDSSVAYNELISKEPLLSSLIPKAKEVPKVELPKTNNDLVVPVSPA